MAVGRADLKFNKSSVGSSEGGGMVGVEIVDGVMNNLWPDISTAEQPVGGTKYRKWFLQNNHPTDQLPKFSTWISVVPTGCTEQVGVGINGADDDNPLQGTLTELTANAQIEIVSDGSDTRNVTIVGLDILGDPLEQTHALTGTTPVLTVATFSSILAAYAASVTAGRTISIKQGAGGTVRGTIPSNEIICFRWLSASAKASGIKRRYLNAGTAVGFWDKLVFPAGVGEDADNASVIAVERI